ncbi:MAG: peptidyl-prolyl cis-trans isomerase, EpsD family [Cytophagales bacterium]|nr:peptidyl-prolyl cis-trans isomerase, EpsD family [Rhizobacter sp.]
MNVDRQLGRQAAWPGLTACVILLSGMFLLGCSKPAEKPASQVAAKVNKQELTVHQINFLLEQQRGLKPEQADAARKQALERLIDQELAIQKAGEIKLDRDPRVMQQVEAARRDVIARAYFERVGNGASKPSEAEIFKYYTDNPALFSQRRVYQLQEWFVEATPAQAEAVRAKALSSKAMAEFTDYLRASNLRFEFNQAVRAAEQLPLNSLAAFAKMADGETVIHAKPAGLQVIALISSRKEPVELARVKPVVEQFLMNEHKSRIIADDLKALRTAAAIRYVEGFGDSADGVGSQPAAPASSSSPASGALIGETAIGTGMGLK